MLVVAFVCVPNVFFVRIPNRSSPSSSLPPPPPFLNAPFNSSATVPPGTFSLCAWTKPPPSVMHTRHHWSLGHAWPRHPSWRHRPFSLCACRVTPASVSPTEGALLLKEPPEYLSGEHDPSRNAPARILIGWAWSRPRRAHPDTYQVGMIPTATHQPEYLSDGHDPGRNSPAYLSDGMIPTSTCTGPCVGRRRKWGQTRVVIDEPYKEAHNNQLGGLV